jgi:hypothetical protein
MAAPDYCRKVGLAAWTHSEAAPAVILAEEQVRLDRAEAPELAVSREGPPDDGCPQEEQVGCQALCLADFRGALAGFQSEPDGYPEPTAAVPWTLAPVYCLDARFHSERQPRCWGR